MDSLYMDNIKIINIDKKIMTIIIIVIITIILRRLV